MPCTLGFNRSLRIEVRGERITGDAGAVTGREVPWRSGVVRWMARRIRDARERHRIRHTMTELLRTALLLAAQCRRDHNDAGALRGDPALRLGVSDRAGTAPLGAGAGVAAHAVARVVAALGKGKNAKVLRDGLARWRIRAMNHGRLPRRLVIDLDSLPAEVHGRQPGSEWNGYSSMSGSARGRCTRRRAGSASSPRSWTGRSGFSARRRWSVSTPGIPEKN